MNHFAPSSLRALPIALGLAAGACCWSSAAAAQTAPAAEPTQTTPPADPNVARLTDEQRWAVLNSITEDSAAAARGELPGTARIAPGIHGEVGVMIGTNGMRAVYGTAEIPLGDDGYAVVSFENSRYGRRR